MAASGRPLRHRVARALALGRLRPGLVVVDVGTGRGEAALHAARRGCQVIALDSSPGAIAIARETLRLSGGESVAPVLADSARIPLRDGCADRVLLLDVAEHLEPLILSNCLSEVRRILAPGGHVVIHTLPNRRALAGYRLLAPFVPGLPPDPRSSYERRVHVNELTPGELAHALHAAGLHYRVWVEEWTTIYARRGAQRVYPDRVRTGGYKVLARTWPRLMLRGLMHTPAASWVGNDIFALAWHSGSVGPAESGPMAPLRLPLVIDRRGRGAVT